MERVRILIETLNEKTEKPNHKQFIVTPWFDVDMVLEVSPDIGIRVMDRKNHEKVLQVDYIRYIVR